MARRRHRHGNLLDRWRGSAIYPFLLIGIVVAIIALCWLLIAQIAMPLIQSWFGPKITEVPLPTKEAEVRDLSDKIREVLLTNKFKYVGKPKLLGDEVYFSSGQDNYYNPLMKEIYVAKQDTANSVTPTKIEGIEAEGDILAMDVSAEYIVYIDTKKDTTTAEGTVIPGRSIMYVYDRNTKQTEKLKDIPYDCPDVFLTGDYVVWVERTGETQDKLYMMDLKTKEMTTLAVYEDSPMGVSSPGVCSSNIVWVEPHPEQPESEQYNVIKSMSLGENAGTITTYEPGMYAFKPMTNGTSIVWSDNFASASSNLYLSQNGAMPKKLAENVSGYGIADNFVAYCQYGRIYVYFLNTGELAQLSKSTEYAMLADVSSHGVTWFDITDENRERDILKFAVVD